MQIIQDNKLETLLIMEIGFTNNVGLKGRK